jgi:acetylornithine deacetylase
VSRDSNLDLIAYVSEALRARGVATRLFYSQDGRKANIFATIGPADRSGVMLSGQCAAATKCSKGF